MFLPLLQWKRVNLPLHVHSNYNCNSNHFKVFVREVVQFFTVTMPVDFINRRLHYFPLGCSVFLLATMLVTYSIAVQLNHVKPFFPYISDAAHESPERNIFSQLLNFASVCGLITAIFRCKQIQTFVPRTPEFSSAHRANNVSFFVSILAFIGVSVVANYSDLIFRVKSQHSRRINVTMHYLGAAIGYSMTYIYLITQSAVGYKLLPHFSSSSLCHVRLSLSVIGFLTLFLPVWVYSGVLYMVYNSKRKKQKASENDNELSKLELPTLHDVDALCHWISALALVVLFFSFVHEFKHMCIEGLSLNCTCNYQRLTEVRMEQAGGPDKQNAVHFVPFSISKMTPLTSESPPLRKVMSNGSEQGIKEGDLEPKKSTSAKTKIKKSKSKTDITSKGSEKSLSRTKTDKTKTKKHGNGLQSKPGSKTKVDWNKLTNDDLDKVCLNPKDSKEHKEYVASLITLLSEKDD